MNEITAPYAFVPLDSRVNRPAWGRIVERGGNAIAPPLHDVPFMDGVCGTINLEIEAETPIFVRGVDEAERFFALPDGRRALPATALRGAIRNVVEIASFSRMTRVNDHRYAVRDLQNRHLYGQFMSDIGKHKRTGKSEPMPLVNAGWLTRAADGGYTIELCDFAKIEYRLLQSLANDTGVRGFAPGEKQSAARKYQTWGQRGREFGFDVDFFRDRIVGRRPMVSEFGKVQSAAGTRKGVLVFTGQPSRWIPDDTGSGRRGSAKHHDFVFFAPASPVRFPLAPQTFRDFEFAHSDSGQQHSKGRAQTPNEEWGFWKERLLKSERVPVFFMTDDTGQRVEKLGLAMMFRLPYKYSTLEATDRVYREDTAGGLDFAECLFGTVRSRDERKSAAAVALKGRVDFSHAIAKPVGAAESRTVNVVLGGPKASYYPNYVEQDAARPGANVGQEYRTWQDDDGRPRGWKRYHTLTQTWEPPRPTGSGGRALDQSRVETKFVPMPAGTVFVGQVHLHNVRLCELGAVLWALELGGAPAARHALGMARPLGYGRCRVRLVNHDLVVNDGRDLELDAAREAFGEHMTRLISNWSTSAQIEALVNIATPIQPDKARYQQLDPGARVNEFVDAKKQRLRLPPAHKVTGGDTARPVLSAAPQQNRPQPGGFVPRPGGAGGGFRPGAGPAPVPARDPRSSRQGWPGMKRGDTLKVRLKELNKKGKWRAEAVDYASANGTIEGVAPPDATAGGEYTVEVIQGGDPGNLNLKWRDA